MAFLTLLEIIVVVALINIDALAVDFYNLVADAVEEITVVSHHQQRYTRA